mmetsp:Transcript_28156/g.80806  ORF Transcript_28156/g.80806 Transcript_28156/m.80806 type:complete len:328 (-) Transcript_28156:12-995(-)
MRGGIAWAMGQRAGHAALLAALVLCSSALGVDAAEGAGVRKTLGFLSRRATRRSHERMDKGPFAYLPPPAPLFRTLALDLPSEPVLAPITDRLVLAPVATPGPPTIGPGDERSGVVPTLPPKGLEGWYATLPPKLVAGWAEGAVDWERYYLRCLGGPPPCPYYYPTTTYAPPFPWVAVNAPSPAAMFAPGMEAKVVLTLTVQNIDQATLVANPVALSAFEQTVQLAVASQSGPGTTPADIQLLVNPGMVVQANITPAMGTDVNALLGTLQGATMLAPTVATLLAAVPSVVGLFTGPVTVLVTGPPAIQMIPMAAPAPAFAPAPAMLR